MRKRQVQLELQVQLQVIDAIQLLPGSFVANKSIEHMRATDIQPQKKWQFRIG